MLPQIIDTHWSKLLLIKIVCAYNIFYMQQVHVYILWERKCVREDPTVSGIVIKPVAYTIFNISTYARVLSDKFSLLKDMK